MELNILEKRPELNERVRLIIEPLAPLSMVSDLPGTYYKVQETPDKFKLAGLFENILGWQFGKKTRQDILKDLKKHYKKKFKEKDCDLEISNSGYQPLLLDFFEIGMVYKSESMNYNDLWKRSFNRMDADVHPKGTSNLDYFTLRKKKWVKEKAEEQEELKKQIKKLKKDKKEEEVKNLQMKLLPTSVSPLFQFFKDNKSSYPMYYSTPTLREYSDFLGNKIQICLKIDQDLLSLLNQAINECSTAYLGNSEGWIEIKIEEL